MDCFMCLCRFFSQPLCILQWHVPNFLFTQTRPSTRTAQIRQHQNTRIQTRQDPHKRPDSPFSWTLFHISIPRPTSRHKEIHIWLKDWVNPLRNQYVDPSDKRGPVRGVIQILCLNFKAWYVAISEGSRVVVGISTRGQSLVAISLLSCRCLKPVSPVGIYPLQGHIKLVLIWYQEQCISCEKLPHQ